MKNSRILQVPQNVGEFRYLQQGTTHAASFPMAGYWIFGMMSWAGFLFLWTLLIARFLVSH